jgi:hypothetical protein
VCLKASSQAVSIHIHLVVMSASIPMVIVAEHGISLFGTGRHHGHGHWSFRAARVKLERFPFQNRQLMGFKGWLSLDARHLALDASRITKYSNLDNRPKL